MAAAISIFGLLPAIGGCVVQRGNASAAQKQASAAQKQASAAQKQADTDRERLEDAQERAAARFRFQYLVLPPPGSLTADGQEANSDTRVLELVEHFHDHAIVIPGRSVNSDELAVNDVKKLDIECVSDACRQALTSDTELANEFIYLEIENVGATEANAIEVQFESTRPENAEVSLLGFLFSHPGGDDEAFSEDVVPSLAPGAKALVPLASIAIVSEGEPRHGEPRGFVGVGDTRKPLQVTWTQMADEEPRTQPVDEPSSSIAYMPGTRVQVGG